MRRRIARDSVEMTDEGLSRGLFVWKVGSEKGLAGKLWMIARVLDLTLLDYPKLTLPLSTCL